MTKFSFFKNGIKTTVPVGSVTTKDVFDIIRTSYLDRVEGLRSDPKNTKLTLDYVTFSSECKSRKATDVIAHSGLICLDFDKVEDVLKLKEEINVIPFVHLSFISPSGDGLKVVVKTNATLENHKQVFEGVKNYFSSYGKIDNTSDVVRACFLCHDKDAYYNPASLEMVVNLEVINKAPQKFYKIPKLDDLLDFLKRGNVAPLEYRQWVAVGLAVADLFGELGRSFFIEFSALFDNNDYNSKYDSFLKTCGHSSNQGESYAIFRNIIYKCYNYDLKISKVDSENISVCRYVSERLDVIEETLKETRSINVEAWTGSGKTQAMVELGKKRGKTVLLVPTTALAINVAAGYSIPCVTGASKFAEIQSALNEPMFVCTLSKFLKGMLYQYEYNTIMIDEAHHMVMHYTDSYRRKDFELLESVLRVRMKLDSNLRVVYLTGTPYLAFLAFTGTKNLRFIPDQGQRFNLIDRPYNKLGTIVSFISQCVGKVLVMCPSISDINKIKSGLEAIDIVDVGVVNSNTKEDDVFYELSQNSKMLNRIILATSLIEEGININDDDINTVIFVDSKGFDVKRFQQFVARPRKMKTLDAVLFLKSYRYEKQGHQTLFAKERSMLRFAEYLEAELTVANGLNGECKVFNTHESFLTDENKLDALAVLQTANASFHSNASRDQIINEILLDKRFVIKTSDIETEDFKVITKNAKPLRELHLDLLSIGIKEYVAAIAYAKNQPSLYTITLGGKIPDRVEEHVEMIKSGKDLVKFDYYLREITFLKRKCVKNIAEIIVKISGNHTQFSKIMQQISSSLYFDFEENAELYYNKSVLKQIQKDVSFIRQYVEFGKEYHGYSDITDKVSPQKLQSLLRKYCIVDSEKRVYVDGNRTRIITVERFVSGTDFDDIKLLFN